MSREMVIETLRPIARLAKETGTKESTLSNWVRMAGGRADLAAWAMTAGRELVRSVMRELHPVPCRPKPWGFSLTEGDG
jgi:transposase-like protein